MSDLQAGPELDAEIARRVFGIDVLGMAPCHHDPDGCDLSVGSRDGQDDVMRPVYLVDQLCSCQESIVRYPDNQIFFGHVQWCLDPVQPYSTTWDGMGLVVERMRELGACCFSLGNEYIPGAGKIDTWRARFAMGDADAKDWVSAMNHSRVGTASAHIAPEAVCLAALVALK